MYLSIYLYLIYLCVKNRKNRVRTQERNLSSLAEMLHCSMSSVCAKHWLAPTGDQ